MTYDLELARVKELIRRNGYRRVCIQLPEGLKPKAEKITRELESTSCQVLIWAGSCFGACDIPLGLEDKVDAVIQWGHSAWEQ